MIDGILKQDHPLFRDFKHRAYEFDTTICFPPGAGGNFIGYQLTGHGVRYDSTNEYIADSTHKLSLDIVIIGSEGESILDLDACYMVAKHEGDVGRLTSGTSTGLRVSMGHQMPLITQLVYSYHTDELICIETNDAQSRLTCSLLEIKESLNRDYNGKPLLIAKLLSNCCTVREIRIKDYSSMVKQLESDIGGIDIRFTPLSWEWHTHCINNGGDMHSADDFKRYATGRLFYGYLDLESFSWLSDWNAYYRYAKPLINCASRITTVDYDRFFFDLDHCGSDVLSRIDKAEIHSYSYRNLAVLGSVLPLVDRGMLPDLEPTIADLGNRLEAARVANGIRIP